MLNLSNTMEIASPPKVIEVGFSRVSFYVFRSPALYEVDSCSTNSDDLLYYVDLDFGRSAIDSRATEEQRLEMLYLIDRWNTYGY